MSKIGQFVFEMQEKEEQENANSQCIPTEEIVEFKYSKQDLETLPF